MYLSISSYTWLPSSLFNKLALLTELGIDSVEIFSTKRHFNINDPEEVQRAGMSVRELGLRNISLHASSDVGDLSDPDEIKREETVYNCQKALDAALLIGASIVNFHPASIESEPDQAPDRWSSLWETLRELSGYAEDRDVRIAIENFPVSYFGGNVSELYRSICDLNLPNVGLCLDVGRAYASGELMNMLNEPGTKLFSVHASDNRGNVDEHLLPGEGSIPWKEVVDGLRLMDFRGPFIFEVRQDKPTRETIEAILDFSEKHGLSGVGQLSH